MTPLLNQEREREALLVRKSPIQCMSYSYASRIMLLVKTLANLVSGGGEENHDDEGGGGGGGNSLIHLFLLSSKLVLMAGRGNRKRKGIR